MKELFLCVKVICITVVSYFVLERTKVNMPGWFEFLGIAGSYVYDGFEIV